MTLMIQLTPAGWNRIEWQKPCGGCGRRVTLWILTLLLLLLSTTTLTHAKDHVTMKYSGDGVLLECRKGDYPGAVEYCVDPLSKEYRNVGGDAHLLQQYHLQQEAEQAEQRKQERAERQKREQERQAAREAAQKAGDAGTAAKMDLQKMLNSPAAQAAIRQAMEKNEETGQDLDMGEIVGAAIKAEFAKFGGNNNNNAPPSSVDDAENSPNGGLELLLQAALQQAANEKNKKLHKSQTNAKSKAGKKGSSTSPQQKAYIKSMAKVLAGLSDPNQSVTLLLPDLMALATSKTTTPSSAGGSPNANSNNDSSDVAQLWNATATIQHYLRQWFETSAADNAAAADTHTETNPAAEWLLSTLFQQQDQDKRKPLAMIGGGAASADKSSSTGHQQHPLQLYYYMQHQEQTKDAVWNKQQHRFMVSVPAEEVLHMSDGVYLSQLAYRNSCDDIAAHVRTFQKSSESASTGPWRVRNCTTQAQPYQPAHFVMIRSAEDFDADLNSVSITPLEMAIVIRGLHEPNDWITARTSALQGGVAYPYYAPFDPDHEQPILSVGLAHEGMWRSAQWLFQQYAVEWKQLLLSQYQAQVQKVQQQQGRSAHTIPPPLLKVYGIGHSLGGGIASLLALEFQRHQIKEQAQMQAQEKEQQAQQEKEQTESSSSTDSKRTKKHAKKHQSQSQQQYHTVEAFAVGFGTPAMVSADVSQAMKERVTTVVADADVIPRLSVATLADTWRQLLQYNFTADCLQDIAQLVPIVQDQLAITLGGSSGDKSGDSSKKKKKDDSGKKNTQDGKKDANSDWTDRMVQNLRTQVEDRIRKEVDQLLNSTRSLLPLVKKSSKSKSSSSSFVDVATLIPPGDCVHFYRDGISWQATYVPCSSPTLTAIDVVSHMMTDHSLEHGYYPALLGYLRRSYRDWHYQVPHDIMAAVVVEDRR